MSSGAPGYSMVLLTAVRLLRDHRRLTTRELCSRLQVDDARIRRILQTMRDAGLVESRKERKTPDSLLEVYHTWLPAKQRPRSTQVLPEVVRDTPKKTSTKRQPAPAAKPRTRKDPDAIKPLGRLGRATASLPRFF